MNPRPLRVGLFGGAFDPPHRAHRALAEAALAQMQDSKITSLFAVQDDRPRGILHIHDCLRAGMV